MPSVFRIHAMFARALIVLLLVLNLGVALWWATRAEPVASPPLPAPAGVTRLQLLSELPRGAVRAPIASAAPDATATTTAAPMHCFAFGPYPDAAALATARGRLQSQATSVRVRETPAAAASGWQVVLPPFADRAAAQAAAERIQAAGFEDYYVQPEGANANGIALGRYGNEAAARRRQAALQAAGFPAQAQPLGAVRIRYWLDAALPTRLEAAAIRSAIGAAQSSALDCSTLR